MHIHILGICGTFMSGIAVLAKAAGFTVTGSDANVYPPMSTQLREQGITVLEGYHPDQLKTNVDCVIVGNVIKRGNPALEYVLAQQIPYCSGPQWLFDHILKDRHVIAVAGTHGKTTTTSILTWILEQAGLKPGFLIGGIPENFGFSARLGKSPYFVIEADEYDSAFFDKRSKFIHYRPKTLILNNLEFDHADIFPDLDAIKLQFHHLLKTIPENGNIISHAHDQNLKSVLDLGCWTPIDYFAIRDANWSSRATSVSGNQFEVLHHNRVEGEVKWDLIGVHNMENALAAIAAADSVGVPVETAIRALKTFKNVKRRLEIKAIINDITIYDDFAHHPTAIELTLAGLRAKIGDKARLIVIIEFGSYTMKTGIHKNQLSASFQSADMVIAKAPQVDWGLTQNLASMHCHTHIAVTAEDIVDYVVPLLLPHDHIVVMSNRGFEGIHDKLRAAI